MKANIFGTSRRWKLAHMLIVASGWLRLLPRGGDSSVMPHFKNKLVSIVGTSMAQIGILMGFSIHTMRGSS